MVGTPLVLTGQEVAIGLGGLEELICEAYWLPRVACFSLVFSKPPIDFIFPQDIHIVAAENEIAQETQRLFTHTVNGVLHLLPNALEAVKLLVAGLHKEKIL